MAGPNKKATIGESFQTMTRRGKVRTGDIVQIPLGDGTYADGYVLDEPLIAFLDQRGTKHPPRAEELVGGSVAFTIWVRNRPLFDGSWPVVGHMEPGPEFLRPVPFFKQDAISKRLSITYDGSEEVGASREECESLERAAVWEPDHVVERLHDHFAGRPNRWVESLRMA